jgi:hypothetical protein
MRQLSENIREAEVEDALVANIGIFNEILTLGGEVRLISRQLRLINGRRRLDILLLYQDQILLVELKAGPFQPEHVDQILIYRNELERLQQDKNLISGVITPIILVTAFREADLEACTKNGVRLHRYSPAEVLTKYYERLSSVASFMRLRPVDLGVFNIALINRVMQALENGLINQKEICEFSKLSAKSVANHLRFAGELGLAARRDKRYYLTDLGLKYVSLREESVPGDALSDEQATLLREYIAKDPKSIRRGTR